MMANARVTFVLAMLLSLAMTLALPATARAQPVPEAPSLSLVPVQEALNTPTPRKVPAPQVLLMGDSMLSANKGSGRSVGRQLEWLIGTRITDRSFVGTRYFLALPNLSGAIPRQYSPKSWDVVVMNGGGNDLMFGCGCHRCEPMLNALISEDGTQGAIPSLVARIRQGGARVVYSGYLRSPGVDSLIEGCRDEGAVLERRLSAMAARDDGVTFVSMADLVPHGDRTFHQEDLIHPSPKGSRAIAERLATALRR